MEKSPQDNSNFVENSILDCSKIIKGNPNDYNRIILRGILYDYLNQYEKAILDFNTIISKFPENKQVLYLRAYSFLQLGDIENLLIDYFGALELPVPNFEVIDNDQLSIIIETILTKRKRIFLNIKWEIDSLDVMNKFNFSHTISMN